jgi:8-oxo-dGTP pyrophosphatase MutT (NUDIX family)
MMVRLLRLAYVLKSAWAQLFQPIGLGVRMILLQDDSVLLVRHTYMRGWHFPGGSMNRWETPMEAAAREAREEAGVELLEPPTLLGIYTSYAGGRSDHVAVYVCHNFRLGVATDRWEIAECRLFALDALPPQLSEGWLRILRHATTNRAKGVSQ